MFGTQKAGVLARPGQRPLNKIVRQGYACRNAVDSRPHPIERGGEIRKIEAGFHPVEIASPARDRRRSSRQCDVRCQQVIMFQVGKRTNDRPSANLFGKFRQVFADRDAVDCGLNCREFTPDLRWCIGFWVERIELAGSAAQQNEQHGFGSPGARRCGRRGGLRKR